MPKGNITPQEAASLKKHAVHALSLSGEQQPTVNEIDESPRDTKRSSSHGPAPGVDTLLSTPPPALGAEKPAPTLSERVTIMETTLAAQVASKTSLRILRETVKENHKKASDALAAAAQSQQDLHVELQLLKGHVKDIQSALHILQVTSKDVAATVKILQERM